MPLNDVKKNYTLGRGQLHFGQFKPKTQIPRGERYLGNSPELSYNGTQDSLDHFSSDGGIRFKDKSVILQQDYAGGFSLDDINMANVGMFFLGEAAVLSVTTRQGTDTITGVEVGFAYQLGTSETDPSGVRQVSAVTVTATAAGGGAGTPAVLGTDYVLDPALARITVLEGSTVLTEGVVATVAYTVDASTRDRVISRGQSIEGSLRYLANNPEGDNIDFFMPWVKITPNGDFSLKGDDWQVLPFTIEILKKGNLEAIYADGRPYDPAA